MPQGPFVPQETLRRFKNWLSNGHPYQHALTGIRLLAFLLMPPTSLTVKEEDY
jgi:hypothetical protein